MTSAPERPSPCSDAWRKAVRQPRARAGTVTERSNSPSPRSLRPAPVMKSATFTVRPTPACDWSRQVPSSAAVSEIMGPAGSPLHRFPPTVAMFQILNEARKARQHCSISGAAAAPNFRPNRESWAMVHVAAISSEPSSARVSDSQPMRLRSTRRRRWGCGSENRYVPPPSHASPGCHGSRSRASRTSFTVFRSMSPTPLSCCLTASEAGRRAGNDWCTTRKTSPRRRGCWLNDQAAFGSGTPG